MEKEYISTEEFGLVLKEICSILEHGGREECRDFLAGLLAKAQAEEKHFDRAYIENLNEKKRTSKIEDINRMLQKMSLEQLDNVRKYTSDEYDEPNHEAEALEVIMSLSRRGRSKAGMVNAE